MTGSIATPALRGTSVDRATAIPLLGIAAQLVLLLLLMRALQIENSAFYDRVAPLALGGAIVNHLLPPRFRLTFFALLSLAGMWLVFGVTQGSWIIGIGTLFIMLCHLPVPRAVRLGMILATAALLALQRMERVPMPWSPAIWSVVGSMLMFRLIVYLYDLPHQKVRTTWEQRFAYFFCLPNVAFPLFPVIDFTTFRRTYYDREPLEIYREGIRWIVRGLVQLVIYRLIYRYATLSPADVHSGTDLLVYMVANYGLYLRVSGQFHLITGMLHLFGFRLPETHRFFYLASSFSDLWRRINVYWKDFMQKLFYMPVFLPLMRKRGETFAMLVSTVVVFFFTWLLHSYQWFWLLGTWLWSATDSLFWALLGGCLLLNLAWEARKGRQRALRPAAMTTGALLRHGVQTAAMFTFMCVLWALWTSPTLGSFATLLSGAHFASTDVAVITVSLMTVALLAAFTYRRAHAMPGQAKPSRLAPLAGVSFLALIPIGDMTAAGKLLPYQARQVLASAREVQLNKKDQEQLQRGYYEKIVGVNRFNGELWQVYSGRPKQWDTMNDIGALRNTSDERLEELIPGFEGDFHGGHITINAFGLRDRDYTLAKAPRTFRIVVLGQSYVMGSGVNDDETFENLVEDRLNEQFAKSLGYDRIEIINLAVPAYSAIQQRADLVGGRVARWSPDMVLCVGHWREMPQVKNFFAPFIRNRTGRTLSPETAQWLDSAGVTPGMSESESDQRLSPLAGRILAWTYADIAARVRTLGAVPVFAYIPTPGTKLDDRGVNQYLDAVTHAGFAQLLDLRNVYAGNDETTLFLAEWDRHPNARGHQIIAEGLFKELTSQPQLFGESLEKTGRREDER